MLNLPENIIDDLPESDYLPDYGVTYNESGLADIHIGHLFGLGEEPASYRTIRPVFLSKLEG
ncbi:hypothetical protein V6R85_24155 [Agrobacterium sp. CCNWLW32]|uniref:hypothetical protein n=1 Tax=Agrobacterium sp. CCNWLW32 TaxID=3122072 RepID=UPI00301049DB